jgi:DNA-binding CsgD family transcriptional regulator
MPFPYIEANLPAPAASLALLRVGAATTYDEFSEAILGFLRQTVAFNAAEIRLRVYDRSRDSAIHVSGNFPAKHHRSPEELALRSRIAPTYAFMERNPTTTVYRGQNHTLPERRQLERLQFFNEFMVPEGWHDNLGMAFSDQFGPNSWIFVNRAFNQPEFDDREVKLFQNIYPYVAAAIRRLHLLADAEATRADLESSLLDLPIATVVLDWQLNVQQSNDAARRLCDLWRRGRPNAGRVELAADILDACRELREVWTSDLPLSQRVLRRVISHPSLHGMQASVTVLRPNALRLRQPSFLIRLTEVIHYAGRARSADAAQALTRLSSAEREVAALVASGESNKFIAERLGKSILTVKNQVHAILEKLGAKNRSELSAIVRG